MAGLSKNNINSDRIMMGYSMIRWLQNNMKLVLAISLVIKRDKEIVLE